MGLLIFFLVLFWVLPIVVCNNLAESKGKDKGGYIALGVFLGWLGALIAALMPAAPTEQRSARAISVGSMRRCPYCAEAVQWSAVVCRWCGRDIPAEEVPSRIPDYDGPLDIDDLVRDARSLVKGGVPMAAAVARLRSATGGDRAAIQAAARRVAKDVNRTLTAGDKGKTFKLLSRAAAKR